VQWGNGLEGKGLHPVLAGVVVTGGRTPARPPCIGWSDAPGALRKSGRKTDRTGMPTLAH